MTDPIQTPLMVSIPSTEGVLANAGKQPVPVLLDLNGDGIPDYQQKWFRDTLSGWLFRVLTAAFPGSPWALALKQLQPGIQAIIDTGAK